MDRCNKIIFNAIHESKLKISYEWHGKIVCSCRCQLSPWSFEIGASVKYINFPKVPPFVSGPRLPPKSTDFPFSLDDFHEQRLSGSFPIQHPIESSDYCAVWCFLYSALEGCSYSWNNRLAISESFSLISLANDSASNALVVWVYKNYSLALNVHPILSREIDNVFQESGRFFDRA